MNHLLTHLLRVIASIVATTALAGAALHSAAASVVLPDESLNYKINYKWGLIQKKAGTAILTLKGAPDGYEAMLTAKTEPWADRIYRLRDTLRSNMDGRDMLPRLYERIAHEDGKYARDVVTFTRRGNTFYGDALRQRKGSSADAVMRQASTKLEAAGPTVDLLSAFYYLRTLDFPAMSRGESLTLNIFSGKQQEILRLIYKGTETIKIDDTTHQAYHIVFSFTSDGKKKSSSNINAWVSADDRRIPLKLEGSLPIGKIQCFYTSGR